MNWDYIEADDYHPVENIQKMSRGIPLQDDDRFPWLAALREVIHGKMASTPPVRFVLSCSALKVAYRQLLLQNLQGIQLIYLEATPELISERLSHRSDHFMNPALISSQFETLEIPGDEESPLFVSIVLSIEEQLNLILKKLTF